MLDIIIAIVLFGTVGLAVAAGLGGLCYIAFTIFKDGGFSLGIIHILGWVLVVLSVWPGFLLTWSLITFQQSSISESWAVVMAATVMLFTLGFGAAMVGLTMDKAEDRAYVKRYCVRNK